MAMKTTSYLIICALSFLFLTGFVGLPVHPGNVEPDNDELVQKKTLVYRIQPEPRGGEAFKLVYLVPVSVDVFWRFKTDFKGSFQLSNRYITEHRLILEEDNVTITEGRYSNAPGGTFRWRTTTHPEQYRMEFQLENPDECGQRFHYGTIQLEPFASYTKVSHTAYFDFYGAYIWVNMPFRGGMTSFLNYTARWENETISRLQQRYENHAEE